MIGLVILDGPDHAGKTHMGTLLKEAYGAKYIHLTYRFKDIMDTYHMAAIRRAIRLSKTQLVVLDRSWMSETCYADAYRGGSKWPYYARMIDRMILGNRSIYVLCLPESLRDHINAFERDRIEREELFNDVYPVIIEYHKLWSRIKNWPHVLRYDYMKYQGQLALDMVATIFAKMAEMADGAVEDGDHDIVGHLPSAKYLFIQAKQTTLYKKPWYPLASHIDVPSLLMSKTLDKMSLEEHEILWASLERSEAVIKHLLQTYDLIPICLGSDAGDLLVRLMGSYSKANNPQNVFHPGYIVTHSPFKADRWFYSSFGSVIIRTRAYREE